MRALHPLIALNRWARVLISVALYMLVSPWGYLAFAAYAAWPLSGPARARRAEHLRACMRGGFGLLHRWIERLGLVEVRFHGSHHTRPEGPYVVVANHPSLLDIAVLYPHFPSSFTIGKPSVFRRSLVGPLLKASFQLEGARSTLDTQRVIDSAVERLSQGDVMIVFPESTRTQPGQKLSFHRLAFEIACRASVPVVPVRLVCQPAFLTKDRPMWRPPRERVRLMAVELPPVLPEDFGGDSRRLLDAVLARLSVPCPPLSPDAREYESHGNDDGRTDGSGDQGPDRGDPHARRAGAG